MSDHFLVRFQITRAAVADAVRLHHAAQLARYRIAVVGIAVTGVGLAIAVDPALGATLGTVGLIVLAVAWNQLLQRWIAQYGGPDVIGETCMYDLDDERMRYEGPPAARDILWRDITAVRANERSIVFARGGLMEAFVPTIAFASSSERDAFLAFADAHVGEHART